MPTPIPLPLFLIPVVLVIAGAVLLWRYVMFFSQAVAVSGTVISPRKIRNPDESSEGKYSYVTRARYIVNGTAYVAEASFSVNWRRRRQKIRQVTVYYVPANPGQGKLGRWSRLWPACLCLIASMALLALFLSLRGDA